MTTEFSEITRLQAGQTLRMAVDKGFTLFVSQGALNVVSPPSWFGETVFTVKSMLMEGEAYVAEDSGWIEVSALSPTQVCGLPRLIPSDEQRSWTRWLRKPAGMPAAL